MSHEREFSHFAPFDETTTFDSNRCLVVEVTQNSAIQVKRKLDFFLVRGNVVNFII